MRKKLKADNWLKTKGNPCFSAKSEKTGDARA